MSYAEEDTCASFSQLNYSCKGEARATSESSIRLFEEARPTKFRFRCACPPLTRPSGTPQSAATPLRSSPEHGGQMLWRRRDAENGKTRPLGWRLPILRAPARSIPGQKRVRAAQKKAGLQEAMPPQVLPLTCLPPLPPPPSSLVSLQWVFCGGVAFVFLTPALTPPLLCSALRRAPQFPHDLPPPPPPSHHHPPAPPC